MEALLVHNNISRWHINIVPYSGKLSREKVFVNFDILYLSTKVFSEILWRHGGQ